MTSGTGAVIGVREAVYYTPAPDTYETRIERLILMGVVILFLQGY